MAATGEIALSGSEKAEVLVHNLETQFQAATDSSIPAVIDTVNVGLRSHFMALVSEHKLNYPEEVLEAIMGIRFAKALRYREQCF
jgi:hypothetical protein